jgi:copper chaperone CopZ
VKKLLPILLVLAGAATAYVVFTAKRPTYTPPVAGTPDSIPLALASQPAADECVRVLDVEGMCCGGCRPKVYHALTAVPGVREAAVELGLAQAIVKRDLDVASLEKALTFEDYVAHARP